MSSEIFERLRSICMRCQWAHDAHTTFSIIIHNVEVEVEVVYEHALHSQVV